MIVIKFKILITIFLSINLSSSNKTPTIWDRIMEEQSEINIIRGLNYFISEDYSKASIEFLKAIEKNPSSNAYSLYGASLYWLGDIDGSIENYEKAIKMDEKNELPWQLKGISHAKKGEIEKALECFKKAEELNSKRSDILMNIGSVYFAMGKIEEAIKYLKKAIENDNKNPLYYYQLGLIYFYTQEFERATENFHKAVGLKDDFEDALLWLGISYEKQNHIREAQRFYKKAISIKEKDYFARYMLARIDRKENLRRNLVPCFELTPEQNQKSIALSIAYSKNSDSGLGNSLKDILSNIKENETAIITIDVIEMENLNLNTAKGELANKLIEKYKPLTWRSITKKYTIDGNSPQKVAEINSILDDIEKLTRGKNYRLNISTKIQKKRDEDFEKELKYIPRDIGNDMGLWVIANPWLWIIEENLEEEKNIPDEINAIANLLIGNIDKAKELFKSSKDPVIANLGLGVISYLEANKQDSLKYFKEVLRYESRNQIAIKNMRWINGSK